MTRSEAHVARRRRAALGAALLACASAGLGGCSTVNWQQWLYDLGDQYACVQGNHDRLGQTAADATCSDPADPRRTDYADYAAARDTRRDGRQ